MIWIAVVAVAAGFILDVDTLLPQPKFEVRITTELKEPYFPMMLNGAEHKCHVPSSDQWEERTPPLVPTQSDVREAALLIGGLSNCSHIAEGYWGYQLCHNDDIWQIHPEKEGDKLFFRETSQRIFLGRISNQHPSAVLIDNTWQLRVPYIQGEVCDFTGEPRKTDIFYVCDENAEVETIKDFREVHICTYEFTIGTNKLCNIFKPPKEVVNYIECYSEEHAPLVEQYLRELEGNSAQTDPDDSKEPIVGDSVDSDVLQATQVEEPNENSNDKDSIVEPEEATLPSDGSEESDSRPQNEHEDL